MTDIDDTADSGRPWSVLEPPPRIDLRTDIPHSARMYDYYLGGKDNFPADRAAAEQALAAFPSVRNTARANRDFMRRATRYLAAQVGVRQFLDIGTGIPTSPNLHEITQEVDPACRVVYVDNDPLVLAHARALLASRPEGRTAYIDASFLQPDAILTSAELRATLDLTQPVALSLMALLHFVPAESEPARLVARLLDALPSGSFLSMTHGTADFSPEEIGRLEETYRRQGIVLTGRTREEFTSFFDGLDLVEPGVTVVHRWRPDPADGAAPEYTDRQVNNYGGVARKP